MKVLIAGGSGLIGRHLATFLQQQSHDVTVLSRKKHPKNIACNTLHWNGKSLAKTKEGYDAIINLCGKSIADKRWTPGIKRGLINSRINPTQALVDHIKQFYIDKPMLLLNASAIGFYPSTDSGQTESQSANTDSKLSFPQQLVSKWEQTAMQADSGQHRVHCLRFGVVLAKNGGIVQKMRPSFKLGLGMSIGKSDANLSWIHIDDLCRAVDWLLQHPHESTFFNFTAPNPCSQKEFADNFAECCDRPRVLAMPSFVVKLAFGQMGRDLMLADQMIFPEKLEQAGFNFHYLDINSALSDLLVDIKLDPNTPDL